MSRLDTHARHCTNPRCGCDGGDRAEERPDAPSDWDSYQFGLRDENAADYWREVVR